MNIQKQKRKVSILGIVCLTFLLLMGSVSAVLLERYNMNDDNDNAISWSAQTFTVGNTGFNQTHNITGVRLKVSWDGTPGNFTIGIRATDPVTHKPTGADLTNVTVNANTIPLIFTWCWFNFTSPYQLLKGITYAIVCRVDDVGTVTWRLDATASSYAGGHEINSGTSGVTWGALLTADYMFEEYGDNILPEAQLVSPANNSWQPTSASTCFNIMLWDNDTAPGADVTVDFYLYMDTYVPMWLGWQNISSQFGISNHFSGHGSDLPLFFGACLDLTCPSHVYAWFTKVTSDNDTFYFPEQSGDGYNWFGDFGSPDPSTDFVYLFNTTNNSKPNIVITYPATGSTLTKYNWRQHPNVNFTLSDAEGDEMTAWIQLYNEYGEVFVPAPGALLLPLYMDNLHNGSYGFNLSNWVTFENHQYNVTIFAEDDAHCAIGTGLTSTYSLFSINATPDLARHISIKDCYPANEDYNAWRAVQGSFTFDMCMNITFLKDYPDVWIFLVDADGATLCYGTRFCTYEPMSGVLWKHYAFAKSYLQIRQTYAVYIGVFISGNLPGHQTHAKSFTKANTQFDIIYDESAKFIGDFSWSWFKPAVSGGYIYRPNLISEDANGDAKFYGVRIVFGTYPDGENPIAAFDPSQLASQWGPNLVAPIEQNYGIGGLGIIAGLIIVGLFTLIPYIVTRKKVKSIPTPITVSFALFGLFLAFGMGFFPVWIFIPPTLIILVIIFYKMRAYITMRKQMIDTRNDEGGS